MPLVNVYLAEGRGEKIIQAVGDGIHRALVDAWGIPEDDRLHIYHEVKQEHFQISKTAFGVERSDDVVVVHITTSPRSPAENLALFKRLPEILEEAVGLRPEDVLISLIRTHPEDWSLGDGKAQVLTALMGR